MADTTEKALTDAVQTFSRQIADQVTEAEERAKDAERPVQSSWNESRPSFLMLHRIPMCVKFSQ